MNKARNPALIELIIVIFFFSLSATVIVQLFMASHTLSAESRIAGNALIATQNWLEELKNDPFDADMILSVWQKESNGRQSTYSCFFNDDFVNCDEADATILAVVIIDNNPTEAGNLIDISASVSRINTDVGGEFITSVSTSIYESSAEVSQ